MKSGHHSHSSGAARTKKLTRAMIPLALCLLATVYAAAFEPTEQDFRDAVLGTRTFTQEQLRAMDLNEDGQVDVADIIAYINPESIEDSWAFIQIEEKDTTVNVVFYLPSLYTGQVTYTTTGTATSGEDYVALSGQVSVNNDSKIVIPVTIRDDLLVEEIETIIIELEVGEDDLLTLGPNQKKTIFIQDNDAIWTGSLAVENLSIGFELTVLQQGPFRTAEMHSHGIGGIPAGVWPVTLLTGENYFRCSVGPIEVPGDMTLFNAAMQRTLVLESNPVFYTDDVVDYGNAIMGRMTESVMVGDGKPYLSLFEDKAISGRFTLVKAISMLPAVDGTN